LDCFWFSFWILFFPNPNTEQLLCFFFNFYFPEHRTLVLFFQFLFSQIRTENPFVQFFFHNFIFSQVCIRNNCCVFFQFLFFPNTEHSFCFFSFYFSRSEQKTHSFSFFFKFLFFLIRIFIFPRSKYRTTVLFFLFFSESEQNTSLFRFFFNLYLFLPYPNFYFSRIIFIFPRSE